MNACMYIYIFILCWSFLFFFLLLPRSPPLRLPRGLVCSLPSDWLLPYWIAKWMATTDSTANALPPWRVRDPDRAARPETGACEQLTQTHRAVKRGQLDKPGSRLANRFPSSSTPLRKLAGRDSLESAHLPRRRPCRFVSFSVHRRLVEASHALPFDVKTTAKQKKTKPCLPHFVCLDCSFSSPFVLSFNRRKLFIFKWSSGKPGRGRCCQCPLMGASYSVAQVNLISCINIEKDTRETSLS